MTDTDRLLIVATGLGELRERVVFVGGMIRSLLITDPAAGPARPTDDVDAIIDVPSRTDLDALNKSLRARGFHEDTREGAPLCRWKLGAVTVDIMPLDPALLGFSNVWYPSTMDHAVTLDAIATSIRIADAPHFCATKLEAFAGRGRGDFFHHDVEDLVALVDGRAELVDELRAAPTEVREFIAERIAELLADESFLEALPGNLLGDDASQGRLPLVLGRLRKIAALAKMPPSDETPRRAERGAQGTPGSARGWLRSSNIRAARYDAATSTLTIDFQGGRTYDYYGVPSTIYEGLMQTASAGRYHHLWIRDRFKYARRA